MVKDNKQNYKYTEEFGYIPKDWDIIELKILTTIITKQTGFDYAATIKPSLVMNNVGNVCPFIQNKDFNGCNINLNTDYYIPMDIVDKFPKITLDKPSILISISGKIGNIGYYNLPLKSFIGGAVGICKLKENVNGKYIMYYLQSKLGQEHILGCVKASSHLNITVQDIRTTPILFPLPPEQEKIAEVLSDVDSLIERTKQLIDKKKNLKIATMQKLLTPKKDWETKELSQVAKYRRGSFPQPYGLDKWYDDVEGLPFVQVFDIDDNFKLKNDTKRKISKLAQPLSVYIPKGSIVLTIQGSIGRIAITQYDSYLDRTLLFFEKILEPFNSYFFMISIYNIFQKEKEKAPGGIIKTITKETLSKFEISYPKKEEQDKIATILSDMDNEIEKLEQEFSKYKDLKIGMMQELLTGKVRLI